MKLSAGYGGRATMPPMLFRAVEVKLIIWTLRWKGKGNIHITYNCIQTMTINAGECVK
jgi:hypothetical protein